MVGRKSLTRLRVILNYLTNLTYIDASLIFFYYDGWIVYNLKFSPKNYS